MEYIITESSNRCNRVANFNISPNNLVDVMNDNTFPKASREAFTVKFDGKPMESHEMGANELANSLLGLTSLLEHANTLVNGQNSKMFVKVRSSFKSGSFDVDIVTLLTFTGINMAANIVELLGFTTNATGTLIWLFKQLKGKRIVEKKVVEGNNIELKVEGRDNLVIVNGGDRIDDIFRLYSNALIRRDLADTTQTLKMPGMSNIAFSKNGEECEKISKDEADYFSLQETDLVDKQEGVANFLITRPDFKGREAWRLSLGEPESIDETSNDFQVRMLDKDFLKNVEKQEIEIRQGTIIRAKFRRTQQKVDRLIVTWEILKVECVYPDSEQSLNNPEKVSDKYEESLANFS